MFSIFRQWKTMVKDALVAGFTNKSLHPEITYLFLSLFFYFARKTLKDIYKHTYSVIHKIIHTFTVNKTNN